MAVPESRLVLFNIAKRYNFGMLIRSANAFGVSELIVVGRKRFNTFGAQGTRRSVKYVHLYTLKEAHAYLKDLGSMICGVEIEPGALPIETHPFAPRTAFMMGNEGTGLSDVQKGYCEQFVYIRQHGHGASLNVNVAGAIVLHHFALWAGFQENARKGNKFLSVDQQQTKLDAAPDVAS